jgi:hypothetical protein
LRFLCSPEYPPENMEDEDDCNKDEIDEAELDINKIEEDMNKVRENYSV